jgi:hypothetical protein
VLYLAQSRRKIQAIKQFRDMTDGWSLYDAKHFIDALAADPASVLPPIPPPMAPAPIPAVVMTSCAYCRSPVAAGLRCENCGARAPAPAVDS